jgi:hypothetical protein
MFDARKNAVTACTVAAVTALATVSPASALNLPSVTVTAPTVTVKAPPVTVKTPPVTVTTPTVPVKAPPIPVKAPPVPVKAPPVSVKAPPVQAKPPPLPAKAPTAPVKVPAAGKPIGAKTPTVSAKAPTGAAGGPSVSVNGPSVAAGGTTSPSGHKTAGAQQGSPTDAVAGQGSTSTGARGAGAVGGEGESASPAPFGAYRSTGGGYGRLPAPEAGARPHARARIARRERALKAKVARFAGCLSDLPDTQRELLELRTGLAGSRPLAPRAVASRLRLGSASFARLEKQAVRELTDAANTHGCSQMSEVVARVASFVGAGFGGGHASAARGGVKGVSYNAAPAKPPAARSSTVGAVLGADIPAVASDVILILLALMAGALAVAAVLADAAGQGPRHAQWRRRVADRIRSLR